MSQSNSIISSAYIVSGQPHILLGKDQSPAWQSLYDSYQDVRREIEEQDADLILYFSTQWLSVLGYMFQGDPNPSWTHVDHNWHDLGSMKYNMKVDTDFAGAYANEVENLGFHTKIVNYEGFPIDTGTIVAQELLNPDNRIPAAMVSCGLYAEKQETINLGNAAAWALKKSGKKAIAVLVSNLSNRFFVKEIDPKEDKISSLKDDEWNKKIIEILEAGGLEDVSQLAREFGRQANADLGFKGTWWLNGLCGQSNDFKGRIFDYKPVWGTGAALVGLYPKDNIQPLAWDSFSSEEGSQAELASDLASQTSATRTTVNLEPNAVAKHIEEVTKKSESATENTSYLSGAIESNRSPEPVGAYPHARKFGDTLFLSGMGPRVRGSKDIPGVASKNSQTGKTVKHDIEVQTESVIKNLIAVLEESGSSLEKVLDIQVFLTDITRDFAGFNKVYAQYFSKIGPTRTTVEVNKLPTPIAVEFKVIAKA